MLRPAMVTLFVALLPAMNGLAAAGEPAVQPVALSERAAMRLLTSKQKPFYPAVARVNYIHGDVYLRIMVSNEGKVKDVHILRGEPLLAAASLRAVRHWQFHPLLNGGTAEPFETLIKISFSLRTKVAGSLPQHPDQDLARAVKPPKLVTTPAPSSNTVRMRVLVGPDGDVLDSGGVAGSGPIKAGRTTVRNWKFLPARWGTMTVPWYVEVDVPVRGGADNTTGEEAGGV